MTTPWSATSLPQTVVVEAYRLDRYDNFVYNGLVDISTLVVEAYRLDRYDNLISPLAYAASP